MNYLKIITCQDALEKNQVFVNSLFKLIRTVYGTLYRNIILWVFGDI